MKARFSAARSVSSARVSGLPARWTRRATLLSPLMLASLLHTHPHNCILTIQMHWHVAGILFDCDGVLVDSAHQIHRAWRMWCATYGLDPAEVLPGIHGRRAEETIAGLLPVEFVAEATKELEVIEVRLAEEVTAYPRCGGPDAEARRSALGSRDLGITHAG